MHRSDPDDGGKKASQAYWNALKILKYAFREATGEELTAGGSSAKQAFQLAVEEIEVRLRMDRALDKAIRTRLDLDPDEDIVTNFFGRDDIDDRSPNEVKEAILAELLHRGTGRFELRPILRAALDTLFDDPERKKPRVGANRHWPRLLHYLREIEEETGGIRPTDISGRGRVARTPADPGRLGIQIDPDRF